MHDARPGHRAGFFVAGNALGWLVSLFFVVFERARRAPIFEDFPGCKGA
jgi:hypothetical protein